MTGRALQCGVQHLGDGGLLLQPARQLARGFVVGAVAQADAGQRAQDRLSIVGAHAQSEPHVGELDLHVQAQVARDDAAHEHITATAGVLGERMGRNVHAQAAVARQVKRRKRQARTPGVVERSGYAACAADAHLLAQVGELHAHRAGSLQPHQPGGGRDARGQVGRVQRVVKRMGDAKTGQLAVGKVLARAVSVVGDQYLVAGLEQGHPHVGDGGEAAGHQHTLQATFQRAQAFFEDEGGGRTVQAVGVAALVLPLPRAHGRDVGEDDRGGLEHPGLGGYKADRRLVVVVDEVGGKIKVVVFHASHGSAPAGGEPGGAWVR